MHGSVQTVINDRQISGEPLDQPVFQYGPFVMTNREEIQKTLMDCEYEKEKTVCNRSLNASLQINWARMVSRRRIHGRALLETSDRVDHYFAVFGVTYAAPRALVKL